MAESSCKASDTQLWRGTYLTMNESEAEACRITAEEKTGLPHIAEKNPIVTGDIIPNHWVIKPNHDCKKDSEYNHSFFLNQFTFNQEDAQTCAKSLTRITGDTHIIQPMNTAWFNPDYKVVISK